MADRKFVFGEGTQVFIKVNENPTLMHSTIANKLGIVGQVWGGFCSLFNGKWTYQNGSITIQAATEEQFNQARDTFGVQEVELGYSMINYH